MGATEDKQPSAMTTPQQLQELRDQQDQGHHQGMIASSLGGHWKYSSRRGFDLTHRTPHASSSTESTKLLTLATTTAPITLDVHRCALVIVDMQNYFLHSAFGRAPTSAGHAALDQLVTHAIPAARRCGMQVIWLNWGLTEEDLQHMPPAVSRAFGFWCAGENEEGEDGEDEEKGKRNAAAKSFAVDKHGKRRQPAAAGRSGSIADRAKGTKKTHAGLGSDCGILVDTSTGAQITAGRLLMRDQWNAALHPPLDAIYAAGMRLPVTPDVWVHKNRMSGLWGGPADNQLEELLRRKGLRTLLFAGVNTDQCVAGTLSDAFSKGFDCVLLRDACGTTSPRCAQEGIEFNASGTWGFNSTCGELELAVAKMAET